MLSFWFLLNKDMRSLLRDPQVAYGVFAFAFMVAVLSSISFRMTALADSERQLLTPGIIWLILLFCGALLFNQTAAYESENKALSGLLLTSVDPSVVYISKCISNFIFLFLVQTVAILVHGILFNMDFSSTFISVIILSAIVCFGYSAIGTLVSLISARFAGREIVLSILLFPLSLPLLFGAMELTTGVFNEGLLDVYSFWFALIVGSGIISFTLGAVLFEFIMHE